MNYLFAFFQTFQEIDERYDELFLASFVLGLIGHIIIA